MLPKNPLIKILFRIAEEHRLELYYAFGLLCLISWFVFNLWVLRDYFFPCWFDPIYTSEGFKKDELEFKKQEILMRYKVSNAMQIPVSIFMPEAAVTNQQRASVPSPLPSRFVKEQEEDRRKSTSVLLHSNRIVNC